MSDESALSDFLMRRFADFYEEVVRIKLAIRDGRLPLYLAQGEEPQGVSGTELAAMVSRRLYGRLAREAKTVHAEATAEEEKAYASAQFVMAALADEIFILELDWPGRQAWLDFLLEFALFRTHHAGRQFFAGAEQLLKTPAPTALDFDLATVFLIALQLGFKGQYRGRHAEEKLAEFRARLLRFVNARRHEAADRPGFPDAYRIQRAERKDSRIAPLSRWYRAGQIGLGLYLVISSLVWVLLWQPFHSEFADGLASAAQATRR